MLPNLNTMRTLFEPYSKINKIQLSEAKEDYINYGVGACIYQKSIYEVANKCKEYIINKGYDITLKISKDEVFITLSGMSTIKAKSELEAIFMVTEMIVNKGK